MTEINIKLSTNKFSILYLTTGIAKEVVKYSSDLTLKASSENGIMQYIDLKSYFATIGMLGMLGQSGDGFAVELRGPEEVYEAKRLEKVINKLIEESSI